MTTMEEVAYRTYSSPLVHQVLFAWRAGLPRSRCRVAGKGTRAHSTAGGSLRRHLACDGNQGIKPKTLIKMFLMYVNYFQRRIFVLHLFRALAARLGNQGGNVPSATPCRCAGSGASGC
jgi:hypothetical protein